MTSNYKGQKGRKVQRSDSTGPNSDSEYWPQRAQRIKERRIERTEHLTTDRLSGSALVIFSLLVIWESRVLPLGTFRQPGPAYIPILLASLLLIFGFFLAATGGRPRAHAFVDSLGRVASRPGDFRGLYLCGAWHRASWLPFDGRARAWLPAQSCRKARLEGEP